MELIVIPAQHIVINALIQKIALIVAVIIFWNLGLAFLNAVLALLLILMELIVTPAQRIVIYAVILSSAQFAKFQIGYNQEHV
jgi:hypothetical protein